MWYKTSSVKNIIIFLSGRGIKATVCKQRYTQVLHKERQKTSRTGLMAITGPKWTEIQGLLWDLYCYVTHDIITHIDITSFNLIFSFQHIYLNSSWTVSQAPVLHYKGALTFLAFDRCGTPWWRRPSFWIWEWGSPHSQMDWDHLSWAWAGVQGQALAGQAPESPWHHPYSAGQGAAWQSQSLSHWEPATEDRGGGEGKRGGVHRLRE